MEKNASSSPVNRRSGGGSPFPCEFCSNSVAVLFCRADSAKLCLSCDRVVHAANALSRKHVRCQICDNCRGQPVAVRCATDTLLLCQECDWDAHGGCSAAAAHDRSPVDGFSGCPAALDLASIWGLDLSDKKLSEAADSVFSNWDSLDSILPVDDSWVRDLGEEVPSPPQKAENSSSGKRKQVILQQLVELLRRDLARGAEAGSNCGWRPATPERNRGSDLGDGGSDVRQQQHQQQEEEATFTSLLMLPARRDPGGGDRAVEEDMMWGCNASADQNSQVLISNALALFSFISKISVFFFFLGFTY